MDIRVILKLVETYKVDQLAQAEKDLLEGNPPSIDLEGDPESYLIDSEYSDPYREEEIVGDDHGDDLTNVKGALWIKKQVVEKGMPLNEAIRLYVQKVKNTFIE